MKFAIVININFWNLLWFAKWEKKFFKLFKLMKCETLKNYKIYKIQINIIKVIQLSELYIYYSLLAKYS